VTDGVVASFQMQLDSICKFARRLLFNATFWQQPNQCWIS